MAESRARFEEAYEIIMKAWTEEKFSFDGKFWKFKDVSIWPRPFQQPHPQVWIPFTGSKETIDFAGRHNLAAVLPAGKRGLTEDIVGYYAKSLAKHGHRITPEHLCLFTDAFVADSKQAALDEYSPYYLYFTQVLWHHGSLAGPGPQPAAAPQGPSKSHDYIRPENQAAAAMDREKIRNMTRADVEARVNGNQLAWGSAKEVAEQLIEAAEHGGANSILLNLNVGAVPHEMFIEQIRRFGRDVLPRLQAHHISKVPAALEDA
jgi:alkanesulfonate monooxygenase SsuD/methylene tetrahydromethanopterin reductase-like flavin-dependent oxidoreductase (luciferase family)